MLRVVVHGTGGIGGGGGAAGDLNSCNWVVSSDTCATNACTARPVVNIFSSADPYERCCWLTVPETREPPLNP